MKAYKKNKHLKKFDNRYIQCYHELMLSAENNKDKLSPKALKLYDRLLKKMKGLK